MTKQLLKLLLLSCTSLSALDLPHKPITAPSSSGRYHILFDNGEVSNRSFAPATLAENFNIFLRLLPNFSFARNIVFTEDECRQNYNNENLSDKYGPFKYSYVSAITGRTRIYSWCTKSYYATPLLSYFSGETLDLTKPHLRDTRYNKVYYDPAIDYAFPHFHWPGRFRDLGHTQPHHCRDGQVTSEDCVTQLIATIKSKKGGTEIDEFYNDTRIKSCLYANSCSVDELEIQKIQFWPAGYFTQIDGIDYYFNVIGDENFADKFPEDQPYYYSRGPSQSEWTAHYEPKYGTRDAIEYFKPGGTYRSAREELANYAMWQLYYDTPFGNIRVALLDVLNEIFGIDVSLKASTESSVKGPVYWIKELNFGLTQVITDKIIRGEEFVQISEEELTQKHDMVEWLGDLKASSNTRQWPLAYKNYADQIRSNPSNWTSGETCVENHVVIVTASPSTISNLSDIGDKNGDGIASSLSDVTAHYAGYQLTVNGPSFANNTNKPIYTSIISFGMDGFSGADAPLDKTDFVRAAELGGGKFYKTLNFQELVHAIFHALQANKGASAAPVATSSPRKEEGLWVFKPTYTPGSWIGDLIAYQYERLADGSLVLSEPRWSAHEVNDQLAREHQGWWSRFMITYDEGTEELERYNSYSRDGDQTHRRLLDGRPSGIPFIYSYFSKLLENRLFHPSRENGAIFRSNGPGGPRSNAVNYMKYKPYEPSGDASEGRTMSVRTTYGPFGDFVNSKPIYVAGPPFNYPDAGYNDYQANFANRRPIVYIGSNDGFLHGFDARNGREVIAYLPSMKQSYLNPWISPSYGDPNIEPFNDFTDNRGQSFYHYYYSYFSVRFPYYHAYGVDGSPITADVNNNGNDENAWKTILVVSLGLGGKGLFALNITDPDGIRHAELAFKNPTTEQRANDYSLSTGNAKNIILWEFKHRDTEGSHQDPRLGYVLGQPKVDRVKESQNTFPQLSGQHYRWIVGFGNGYVHCRTGETCAPPTKPALFILDAETGEKLKVAEVGDVDVTVAEGLSEPAFARPKGSHIANVAYAGDLAGNIWRFDLSRFDEEGRPVEVTKLFTATEPVTAPPLVMYKGNDTIVLVGSGKLIEAADKSSDKPGAFYGIVDNGTNVNLIPRDLCKRKIVSIQGEGTGALATELRRIEDDPEDNQNCSKGWYIPLTNGERVVAGAASGGSNAFFSTINPNAGECESSGTGFMMGVNANDGLGAPLQHCNSSGECQDVSGISQPGMPAGPQVVTDPQTGTGNVIFGSDDGDIHTLPADTSGQPQGGGASGNWFRNFWRYLKW